MEVPIYIFPIFAYLIHFPIITYLIVLLVFHLHIFVNKSWFLFKYAHIRGQILVS